MRYPDGPLNGRDPVLVNLDYDRHPDRPGAQQVLYRRADDPDADDVILAEDRLVGMRIVGFRREGRELWLEVEPAHKSPPPAA